MIRSLNKLKARKGFTIVELMVVLVALGIILIFAVDEYLRYLDNARITRANADIEELIKAIRLYNIKEEKRFETTIFSPINLGSFVGNYLEKEAPLDPWGNYYRHDPDMGIVYSCGPNKKSEVDSQITESDDIVQNYLPKDLFITRAEYVDVNLNNHLDFNDYVELTFSKPATVEENCIGLDFDTTNPEKALGTVSIKSVENNPMKARITFIPPIQSQVVVGETCILPRKFIESIHDKTPAQQRLQRFDNMRIVKKKK